MMNPAALFGGGGENGNMFGEIIQTVGSTITEKINSGEINQEELMNEALGMMGQLNKSGHGDMLSSMMNMMGGVGGGASAPHRALRHQVRLHQIRPVRGYKRNLLIKRSKLKLKCLIHNDMV